MKRVSYLYYVLFIVSFILLTIWLLVYGQTLKPDITTNETILTPVPAEADLWYGNQAVIIIIQIIISMLVIRVVSYLAAPLSQPSIISEMVAGILLGPSLFGLFFPGVSALLFPPDSLNNFHFLSQFGLIIFLFIIGMEMDIRILKHQTRVITFISHAGLLIPFLAGIILAYALYQREDISTSFAGFAVFLGVSLSVTAFPLLIRIIQERGYSKIPLGAISITSVAVVNMSAWIVLAIVLIMTKAGNMVEFLFRSVTATAYIALMLYGVRPLLKKVGSVYASREIFNRRIVSLIFLVLFSSACLSEVIGIHFLFGAFLAGVVMPQNLSFKKILTEKIEDFSIVLLLPLFYVFSGLRTNVVLLNQGSDWLIFLGITIVAVSSRVGGTLFMARAIGQSWKDALSLGVLMNARGLMALIVFNIGYDMGIISPKLFTMLVLMAFLTTVLTEPFLNYLERLFAKEEEGEVVFSAGRTSMNILISFGPPKMGSTLLRLADQLTLKHNKFIEITALHITPSSEVRPYEAILYEKEGFQPIRSTAQLLGLKINTIYRNTEEVDKEIAAVSLQNQFDLILVGAARTMFRGGVAGGVLKPLLEGSETNIGILIDRGFVMAESILMLLGSENDRALLQYATRFRTSNHARVTILKTGDGQSVDLSDKDSEYSQIASTFNEVIEQRIPDKELLGHFSLILMSIELWNELIEMRATWIKDCPSVLLVRHHHNLKSDTETFHKTEKR